MAEFFLMPQASPTMTVGVVSKWVAPEGTKCTPGTVVAQVETDKATMDIEVFDNTFLRKHLVAEGAEVPPGAPIAILAATLEEDISALVAEAAKQAATPKEPPAGDPPKEEPPKGDPAKQEPPKGDPPKEEPPAGDPPKEEPPKQAAATPSAPAPIAAADNHPTWSGHKIDDSIMESRGTFRVAAPRVMASPLARARAAELGVSLSRVKGSGPGGRIVVADIAEPTTQARPQDSGSRVTQMRKTIARRLTEVHQQVPVFFLTASFDATPFVRLKAAAAARDVKVSLNDLLVKAVAAALREVPAVNAQWMGDQIVQKGAVDIGVAVALPEGLITPVIRDADQKGVRDIATEIRELAGRAKAGKLNPEEYTGSTFTISNLGMFDIEHFTAILNPPEAAILAVGSALEVPAVVAGQMVVQSRMKVTMTCDHRVIDGVLGARFLQALRAYVENPGLLTL